MSTPLRGVVGSIIFTVLELLVVFFDSIAVALPQFTPKKTVVEENFFIVNPRDPDVVHCATLWGLTKRCSISNYQVRGNKAWVCHSRYHYIAIARVFCLVSCLFALVTFVFCLLWIIGIFRKKHLLFPAYLSIVVTLLILAGFICISIARDRYFCEGEMRYKWAREWKFGVGFYFFVLSFTLQAVNTIVLFVYIYL